MRSGNRYCPVPPEGESPSSCILPNQHLKLVLRAPVLLATESGAPESQASLTKHDPVLEEARTTTRYMAAAVQTKPLTRLIQVSQYRSKQSGQGFNF